MLLGLCKTQYLTYSFVQALSPDNTYGVDSGGDPNEIPKLTFEEFKVL
jgi:Zn-dependent M16 (insulinase) family peptidase